MNENKLGSGSALDQKTKIRERYKGIHTEELDIIPALPQKNIFNLEKEQNVVVYARVSTDDPRQTSSYELQKNHYQDIVNARTNWKLINIYADEGISGTSLQHRDAFKRMIADCEKGNIDLIITKSVSRFARNVVDCLGYARNLLALPHPVGIYFETERLNTLDPNYEMILSFIATLAQEESHTKSEVMNASIEMRFRRGIFLTPVLLGYNHDENGNLVINEQEAKIVKLIFMMYLNGCTCLEIASTLTELGCKTKRGNTVWSPHSILQILQNERHCGDVLARKTFTPNYLDHKSKKNKQDRNQYRKKEHHNGIISRDDFIAVQRLISNAKYGNKGILPELKVIPTGLLKGFVSINPRWAGFNRNDYINASKSVYENMEPIIPSPPPIEANSGAFDLRGYEIARSQFFDNLDRIAVTFTLYSIRFSAASVKKFNSPFVELLIHPEKHIFVVHPVTAEHKNAMRWTETKSGIIQPRTMKGTAFLSTLFSLFNWNTKYKYRIIGVKQEHGTESILVFNLKETEIFISNDMIAEQKMPSPRNTVKLFQDTMKRNIRAYPPDWVNTFGNNFYNHAQAQELAVFEKEGLWHISNKSIPYKNHDLKITSRTEREKNIEQILSEMKEHKYE